MRVLLFIYWAMGCGIMNKNTVTKWIRIIEVASGTQRGRQKGNFERPKSKGGQDALSMEEPASCLLNDIA